MEGTWNHCPPERWKGVIERLQQNNMHARYVPCKADVPAAVSALLGEGDAVAVGGSKTLEESGVLDLLRSGPYRFIDRYEAGLSAGEEKRRFMQAFYADAFLCSANAITKNGEIYQVDGLSNRIAPLVYGPDSVILVAGVNKIVDTLQDAVYRVRTITAPAIVQRHMLDAPCAQTGRCVAAGSGDMAAGCMCDARRCCNFLVLGRQRVKDRIKVILVGEPLGW